MAQDSTANIDAEEIVAMPYEIIVTPFVTRRDLRGMIDKVEDDFIDKFNELNLDDDYDIQCGKITPTASHIRKRVCEPNFYIQARADDASKNMFLLGNPLAGRSFYLQSSHSLEKEKAREYEILQEKVDELTQENRDLRGIGLVLGELKRRLENFGKEEN